MAEHTKEPWDYSQFAGATPDDPPDPAYVCELNNDDYPDGVIAWAHQDRPTEQQDADETDWQEFAAWQAAVDAGEVEECLLDPSSCPVCTCDQDEELPF